MVLAYKDNDRYYFFTNPSFSNLRFGMPDEITPEESLIFKLPYRNLLIGMGYEGMTGCILKSHPSLFGENMTVGEKFYEAHALFDKCREYQQTEDDMLKSPLLVAKDDKCFLISKSLEVREIGEYFACGKNGISDDLISALMIKYEGLPMEERVKNVFRDYLIPIGSSPFPIYMTDSREFKTKVIRK